MAVGNAVYPIDTSALDPTIYFVFYDSSGPLGSIQHLDRPGSLEDFTDPTPYISYLNAWFAVAAADTPPLSLAQAIALKESLVGILYAAKRQTLTTQAGLATWATNIASSQNTSVAPGNGWSGSNFSINGLSATDAASSLNSPSLTTSNPVAAGSKTYWEIGFTDANNTSNDQIGIVLPGCALNNSVGRTANGWSYRGSGDKENNNSSVSYGVGWAHANDIIGVALDLTNGNLTFYHNGASQGVAFTVPTGSNVYYPAVSCGTGGATFVANFGGPFAYTPPTGFGPVNPVAYSASDLGAIDAGCGSPDQISGTPATLTASQVASIQAAIVTARQNLLAAYNTISANLAACTSIAAVIAFDITVGWP